MNNCHLDTVIAKGKMYMHMIPVCRDQISARPAGTDFTLSIC